MCCVLSVKKLGICACSAKEDFEQRAFNPLFIIKLQNLREVHFWKDKQTKKKTGGLGEEKVGNNSGRQPYFSLCTLKKKNV